MAACSLQRGAFQFSKDEIEEAVRETRLLTMEIEFSRRCNLHCPYCYVPPPTGLENELSEDEIRDVILQAKDLGARKIIILGGEPTLYPHTLNIVRFITSHDLRAEMFTNGSGVSDDFARQLFQHRTRVVLKMNSLNENTQDILSGQKGSFKLVNRAFLNLKRAGYPSREALLAVATVICRQNIDELVAMWQWLRDQGIAPYFEVLTPQGRAKEAHWLYVGSRRLRQLFTAIADIDRNQYGRNWEIQPPLVGERCLRHKFSCVVTSEGDVMPCVGVNIPIGNIRDQKLYDIIRNSEILHDLKDHIHTIKGPCRSCRKADMCYGCRGTAYQLTGDYLASDPMCWENADRQEEIACLPFAVGGIMPQQPPMRLVDNVVRTGERSGEVSVKVSSELPFVGPDGMLDELAYFEMMAQAIAALNAFKEMGSEGSAEGYLVGARDLEILESAEVGDTLNISVYKHARLGQVAILKGTVSRNDQVLARGEIKIWHRAATDAEHASYPQA